MASEFWYLYVKKTTLEIYRSSPSLEIDDECHVIEIEKELGVSFIHSPHLLDKYLVYYDGEKAHFIEKEEASSKVIQFFFTPAMFTENIENPDFTVVVRDGELDIVLKKELRHYTATLYSSLEAAKQVTELYISAKNDPNQLLEIIKINMMELAQKLTLTFSYKYKVGDVGFFTKKVFDRYGLIIEQG